jgi:hypothetical protein
MPTIVQAEAAAGAVAGQSVAVQQLNCSALQLQVVVP